MNEVFHFRGALVEGSAAADVIVEDGVIAEHWDVMPDVVEGGPTPASPF